MKYYGSYIVGMQSHWIAMAAKLGVAVATLMPHARRSVTQVAGEWLWLIELWDLPFYMEYWGWKNGLYPLKQYQAAQLGIAFLQIRDSKGERILTDTGAIATGKQDAAIVWARTLAPAMPIELTRAQELTYIQTNNITNKIKALFDAFEYEPLTP